MISAKSAPRVLFILKYREASWGSYSHGGLSSGLLNSATFVMDMLVAEGIVAKLVQVADNNAIDREVTQFKPTHVIIEALWVVPEKFDVLTRLHPDVHWIVRNHSETPFIANEGIAVDWLLEYVKRPRVSISNNAPRSQRDFLFLVKQLGGGLDEKVVYLPNVYPITDGYSRQVRLDHCHGHRGPLNVGCFGAIRPLKNHLTQAIAALKYSDRIGVPLNFHINATRLEGNGDPILKNLRSLFAHLPKANLIEHGWCDHKEFLDLVASMDVGLQCSFSETFNIVGADFVSRGVPLVGSQEIPWLDQAATAPPDSTDAIADAIGRVLSRSHDPSIGNLERYSEMSRRTWLSFLSDGGRHPHLQMGGLHG